MDKGELGAGTFGIDPVEEQKRMEAIQELIPRLAVLVAPSGPAAGVACLLAVARSIKGSLVGAGFPPAMAEGIPIDLLSAALEIERRESRQLDALEGWRGKPQ